MKMKYWIQFLALDLFAFHSQVAYTWLGSQRRQTPMKTTMNTTIWMKTANSNSPL